MKRQLLLGAAALSLAAGLTSMTTAAIAQEAPEGERASARAAERSDDARIELSAPAPRGERRDQDRPNRPSRPTSPDRPDTPPRPDTPTGRDRRDDRSDRPQQPGSDWRRPGQPGNDNDRRGEVGRRDRDQNRDRPNRPAQPGGQDWTRPDRPDRPRQDWNRNDRDRPGQDWNRGDRDGQWRRDRDRDRERQDFHRRFDSDQWRRDYSRRYSSGWWRNDSRWRGYNGVRFGFYFAPSYGYYSVPRSYWGRDWRVGDYLPSIFWRYRLDDWRTYGLGYPPAGTRWVLVDNNIYLIDEYDGYVIDVIYDAWRW